MFLVLKAKVTQGLMVSGIMNLFIDVWMGFQDGESARPKALSTQGKKHTHTQKCWHICKPWAGFKTTIPAFGSFEVPLE